MADHPLIPIGMLIVFAGIVLIFIGAFLSAQKDSNVKFSFFGLFGFIPFGFSNDKRLFFISVALTLTVIIFSLFFYSRAFKP